ncbi:MAG: oligosaccharide flippase family protein [Planctomycetaceae bacterium]|nr:oligosaccharide flippase family protein [Planctomycetaceae bacterium]
MNPSQRIVLNTIATYTRSVLGAGLMLFSQRWAYKALGGVDFGLFNLLGSIIVFITFLNSVMAGSAARHYAFSMDREEGAEVNRWFNAALSMHLVFAAVLVLAGWRIGEYVITRYLTIPPERLAASLWVFRISLISAFFSMLSIPFVAMFTAKQRITDLAVWNMLYSILVFVLAWILRYVPGDRLKFYAFGMVSIVVFTQLAQILWALAAFRECRICYRQWFDKSRLKEILSFAGWTLFGNSGMLLRNQGSAILLNIYFGPAMNAAYGIANQVSTQTNQLAAAMIGAFSPEITTSEGRGDRKRMLSLSQRASKLGTLLVLIFTVPLMAEMEYVLKLWLGNPPPYCAMFCWYILATFIIDRLTVGNMLSVIAYGRIAAYQATVGASLVLTLPLAWIFLALGSPPVSVGIAFVVMMIAVSMGRVLWVRRLFGVQIHQWISAVVLPCGIVAFTSTVAALLPRLLLPISFGRLVSAVLLSVTASLLTGWFWALDHEERQFFQQNLRHLRNNIVYVLSGEKLSNTDIEGR